MPVFGLFALYMLAEIASLILVGSWIGLWPALALVVLAVVLGTSVIRAQGAGAVADLRGQVGPLRHPAGLLADRMLVILAGLMLIVPGFLSDGVALLLLIAPLRRALVAMGARRVQARTAGWPPGPRSEIIEVEYSEINPAVPPDPRGPSGWTRH